MEQNILYNDSLVTLSDRSIVLKNYYLPIVGPKKVAFESIESVSVKKPSLMTGKWRIWGTGNFSTWFPLDFSRPQRDRIFFITQKGKSIRIGFTVKDSEAVVRILGQKGLLDSKESVL